MKNIIRLEELGMFLLGILLYSLTSYPWWLFVVLLLVPDVSMLGYLINNRTGAVLYNIVHHRGIAVAVWGAGYYLGDPATQMTGAILFAHSSLDRMLGYGLKFTNSFQHTHLGWIGNDQQNEK